MGVIGGNSEGRSGLGTVSGTDIKGDWEADSGRETGAEGTAEDSPIPYCLKFKIFSISERNSGEEILSSIGSSVTAVEETNK